MLTNKQHQEAGDQSLNIQANNFIIKGIAYSEARQIALDVFEANFLRLTNEAAEIAKKRVEEFVDSLLGTLMEQAPEALEAFIDPDMQHCLFTAQKEHARTGNEDHAEMLVTILVARAKETDRTLKQIVLNEAVSIAPKLTISQYGILSIIFLVKNTVTREMDSLAKLIDDAEFTISLLSGIEEWRGSTLHLKYTSCCTVNKGDSIPTIFRDNYPGLFQKGFTKEDFYSVFDSREQGKQFGNKVLVPCLHNSDLWQVHPTLLEPTDSEYTKLINKMNVDGKTLLKLQRFLGSYAMTPQEVSVYLHKTIPEFHQLNNLWFGFGLQDMELTSVGVAIAQANLKRKFNANFDLARWL